MPSEDSAKSGERLAFARFTREMKGLRVQNAQCVTQRVGLSRA